MQTTEEETTEQNLRMQSPCRSKMAMREMIKYGCRPGTGLGAKSDGIIAPIKCNGQKGRAGIGYQPLEGKTRIVSSGKKVFVPEHVSNPGQSSTPKDDIIGGMGKLFVNMIEECCEGTDIKTPTIRDAELGEELQNWTASPSLVRRESY
ncbi:hypothetical protein A4A49_00636 [Nicotiana attenuata]|uniref:G-patch domain-containing protein n=1 Tax=Nicotiana attenuata TaxID=49451 RepID=A0A314LJ19_NICAT|nr:hypothetical protein A4A49_00636 [Nicotiana attenuata]